VYTSLGWDLSPCRVDSLSHAARTENLVRGSVSICCGILLRDQDALPPCAIGNGLPIRPLWLPLAQLTTSLACSAQANSLSIVRRPPVYVAHVGKRSPGVGSVFGSPRLSASRVGRDDGAVRN